MLHSWPSHTPASPTPPPRPHQEPQELLLIYLYRNRLPLKNRLLLDTVRTWLDFSNLK